MLEDQGGTLGEQGGTLGEHGGLLTEHSAQLSGFPATLKVTRADRPLASPAEVNGDRMSAARRAAR